jgi:hypothetical protein
LLYNNNKNVIADDIIKNLISFLLKFILDLIKNETKIKKYNIKFTLSLREKKKFINKAINDRTIVPKKYI